MTTQSKQAPENKNSLLSATQLAEEVQLTPATIYTNIRNGKIPAVRIGRNVRIRRSDWEKYLDQSRTMNRTEALA